MALYLITVCWPSFLETRKAHHSGNFFAERRVAWQVGRRLEWYRYLPQPQSHM